MNLKDFIAEISRKLNYPWWQKIGSWPISQVLVVKYWGKPNRKKTLVITNTPF